MLSLPASLSDSVCERARICHGETAVTSWPPGRLRDRLAWAAVIGYGYGNDAVRPNHEGWAT